MSNLTSYINANQYLLIPGREHFIQYFNAVNRPLTSTTPLVVGTILQRIDPTQQFYKPFEIATYDNESPVSVLASFVEAPIDGPGPAACSVLQKGVVNFLALRIWTSTGLVAVNQEVLNILSRFSIFVARMTNAQIVPL